jgi:glycerophosphoryl diester phosphodiesterase
VPLIVAHRGFSGRQPEMTRAAYRAAIDWSAKTGIELGLECDVHFSADDQLICLHDLSVKRTSRSRGRAHDMTVSQLKRLDFSRPGPRRWGRTTAAQRELVTLQELLIMVREARDRGVPVSLVVETKHHNPRGADVEYRLAEQLAALGWDAPGSPVRVISFDQSAVERLGRLLPHLERTFLIEKTFGPWADGRLFDGVCAVGPDLLLIKEDPGFVARAHAHGIEVHAWTVNDPADIRFCRDLGVDSYTTDFPDRVAKVLL